MTFATGMIVQVEMHPCLAHPPKYITPQQNQHEANGALQKGCRTACQCHAQQDHCRTDREQGERMPKPPRSTPQHHRPARIPSRGHGTDCGEVIGFERMAHSGKETQGDQRELHGRSSPSADTRQLLADQHVDDPASTEQAMHDHARAAHFCRAPDNGCIAPCLG